MTTFFLKGDKVCLRGLRDEDCSGNWAEWFDSAEACQYNDHHRFPTSPEANRRYLETLRNSDNVLALAIINAASGEHIGNVSVQGIDWLHRSGAFAIIIGESECWNGGFGFEAARLILEHAFDALNLRRITCLTSEANAPMRGLAEKLGMVQEGRRRQALFKHGRYFDTIEYGLFRDEFYKAIGR